MAKLFSINDIQIASLDRLKEGKKANGVIKDERNKYEGKEEEK